MRVALATLCCHTTALLARSRKRLYRRGFPHPAEAAARIEEGRFADFNS